MKLHPYQQEAVNAALQSMSDVTTKSMIISPTGSGKSFMIKSLASHNRDLNTLILAPRVQIVDQQNARLGDLPHGILCETMGKKDRFSTSRCLIASFQTAATSTWLKPDLVIADECHMLGPDSVLLKLLSRFSGAKIIGFTATPSRGNLLLEHQGWKKEYEVLMQHLINEKLIVPPVSMATKGSSYAEGCDDDSITVEIVANLLHQILHERRNKVVVFCKNVKHAKMVEYLLRRNGEKNLYLIHSHKDCVFPSDKIAYAAFEQNPERSWLINVGKVTVGVDIPCIDAVAILRDVKNFATLVQMIGRGLRTFHGKDDCLVFDFGQGTKRFGFINDPNFSKHKTFVDKYNLPLTIACQSCGRMHYYDDPCCPYCQQSGHATDAQKEAEIRATLSSNSSNVDLLSWNYRHNPQRIMTISGIETNQLGSNGLIEAHLTFRESHANFARLVAKTSGSIPKIGTRVKVTQVKGDLVRIM